MLTFAVIFSSEILILLYDQIDSIAMGSPLGPFQANIFMCALEHIFLDKGIKKYVLMPTLYRRCVDDTFCILCMLMILFVFFAIGCKLISSCLILIPVMKISLLWLNLAMIISYHFLILLLHLITIVSPLIFF